MKHTAARILLAVLLTLVFSVSAWAYTDTQELTATELAALDALSDMGIIGGYPDGSFRPNAAISRAEFAKLLCQFAMQGELLQTEGVFADVPPEAWYYGWVNRAAEQGWVNGYGDGSYRPQAAVTQQEAAAVLVRLTGVDTANFSWPDDFSAAALDAGILAGIGFDGPQEASRLIACQMLHNLLPSEKTTAEQDEQTDAQTDEQAADTVADGLYLGVVEGSYSGDNGTELRFLGQEQGLLLSAGVKRPPAVGTFIYYTVKDGRIDSCHLLLDAAGKAITSTSALTRSAVPNGPYAWAARRTGQALTSPVEFNSAQVTVLYHSYRNLTVGPYTAESTNYWLGDNVLICEVSADGVVTLGDRESIGLKQQVILLADKNSEVLFLFCFK